MTQLDSCPAPEHEPRPLRLVNTDTHKTNEYSGGCRLFKAVATGVGVQLTPQETHDWEVLMGASFIIDALVDEQGRDLNPLIEAAIAGDVIPGVAEEAVTECKNYFERQSEEKREIILNGLRMIGVFPGLIAEAKSTNEIIDLRLKEADIYSSFLKLDIQESVDARARFRFNQWLDSFVKSGYLGDSFVDLNEDYQEGVINVAPSLHSRITIARATIRELRPGLRVTPPDAFAHIVRMSFEAIAGNRNKRRT